MQDATTVDLTSFDAIWASPPCQKFSSQNHGNAGDKKFSNSKLLDWSIELVGKYPNKIIWIENVKSRVHDNSWGKLYNAIQFLETPIQQRVRLIGGNYKSPLVFKNFKHRYKEFDVCPAVLASEYKQGGKARTPDKERRKATRWYNMKYNRTPTLLDMAYVQGFSIPVKWFDIPELLKENGRPYTKRQWDINICQAIGNGVPVYMAKAFGDVYSEKTTQS